MHMNDDAALVSELKFKKVLEDSRQPNQAGRGYPVSPDDVRKNGVGTHIHLLTPEVCNSPRKLYNTARWF